MEFKDIVVDNDAIVNTEPKELPKEAHDIPQGVKPHLNPNPGYGKGGKTVPAIKTDLVEGERGTPVDVVTEPRPAFKTVQEVYNFLNGIKIKGKSLEDYIDSQGGVTEEELQDAVADLEEQIGAIPSGTKLYKHVISGSCVASDTNTYDFSGTIINTKETALTSNEVNNIIGGSNTLNNVYIDVLFGSGPLIGFLRYSGNIVLVDSDGSIVVWYGFDSFTLTLYSLVYFASR
jgi:hypothetical protein